MTESPRIMTRSGSAGDGAGASRIGCWPAYPPAPGTACTEPVEARCVVPTTRGGIGDGGEGGDNDHHRRHDAGHRRPQADAPAQFRQADRPLDQVVARRRHGQRDGNPEEVQGPGRQAGPGAVQVDDHRPVPEVDPIGDGTDEVQRPPGQAAGEPPGFDEARVRHDQRGERGAEKEPAFEHEVGRQAAGRARTYPEHCRGRPPPRGRPNGGSDAAGALGWRARRRQEGDGRTGHEVEQARVGPVVDARGIHAGVEQRRHQHRGAHSESDGDRHADPTPAAPPVLQQHQEHQRPDEVELLLDRQRPRVLERRGRGELGEIGLVGENQVPVVHIEQGGDGVAPEARKIDEAVGARAAEEQRCRRGTARAPARRGRAPAAGAGPGAPRRRPG